MYDGRKLWSEVRTLEYEVPMNEATIIPDYKIAKNIMKEIQDNVENIIFTNNSAIGEILDKNSFDKIAYSKELKIFELVPVIVDEPLIH